MIASVLAKRAVLRLRSNFPYSGAAGFPQDYVLEAFNAMGAIAVPAIQAAATAGTLSANTAQGVDSNIGGGIEK